MELTHNSQAREIASLESDSMVWYNGGALWMLTEWSAWYILVFNALENRVLSFSMLRCCIVHIWSLSKLSLHRHVKKGRSSQWQASRSPLLVCLSTRNWSVAVRQCLRWWHDSLPKWPPKETFRLALITLFSRLTIKLHHQHQRKLITIPLRCNVGQEAPELATATEWSTLYNR